jgi:hypothetical protein
MAIALACAWRPRGELARLQRAHPQLLSLYMQVIITVPPEADQMIVAALHELPQVTVVVAPDWSHGRHLAIQQAADYAPFVHYADLDRMLRWVETDFSGLQGVLARIQRTDCLIIGRTPAAMATHAHALQDTEAIINAVFSRILGQSVDLGGGTRGFSREAVQFLLRHSAPGKAIGTDSSWPVLLQRAGFKVEAVTVDGLNWEVPDRFRTHAVDTQTLLAAAEVYDGDAAHWKRRVQIAREVIEEGLAALSK